MKKLTHIQDRLISHIAKHDGRLLPWMPSRYKPSPDAEYLFGYGADWHFLKKVTVYALENRGLVSVKPGSGWGYMNYLIELTEKGWAYALGEEYYPGPDGWDVSGRED